jgi:predicted SAM-dependent methyltransferase
VIPRPFRFRLRLLATELAQPRERRRARLLAHRQPLLLHIGSQKVRKEGWVNVDLLGFPVDLAWNLLRPLPFGPGTVDAIFHEHLLEHFVLSDGLSLARESYRVLAKGGLLRIAVPDAGAYARSYALDDGDFLGRMKPNAPTRLLAMQELFYWPNHRTMYDFETLRLLLMAAGFEHVAESAFGQTRLPVCPDSEHRRAESIYVEALKS